MFIDSHCHIHFPELFPQIPAIKEAMQEAKVDGALVVSTDLDEFDETVHCLALEHACFWASVGVHPTNEQATNPSVEELVQRGSQPKVLAVGETGVDYFRLEGRSIADMEWQRQRFRTHIRAARELQKPLIIHTRAAVDDTLAILQEEGETGKSADCCGGVFHCFTESLETAKAALEMGFYISFSGIVTFRTAQDLRDVLAYIPMERVLIETDSPYLAPVPHRGKTNNPSYVAHVAQQVATVKNLSVAEVGEITSRNFKNLFKPEEMPTPLM